MQDWMSLLPAGYSPTIGYTQTVELFPLEALSGTGFVQRSEMFVGHNFCPVFFPAIMPLFSLHKDFSSSITHLYEHVYTYTYNKNVCVLLCIDNISNRCQACGD